MLAMDDGACGNSLLLDVLLPSLWARYRLVGSSFNFISHV